MDQPFLRQYPIPIRTIAADNTSIVVIPTSKGTSSLKIMSSSYETPIEAKESRDNGVMYPSVS